MPIKNPPVGPNKQASPPPDVKTGNPMEPRKRYRSTEVSAFFGGRRIASMNRNRVCSVIATGPSGILTKEPAASNAEKRGTRMLICLVFNLRHNLSTLVNNFMRKKISCAKFTKLFRCTMIRSMNVKTEVLHYLMDHPNVFVSGVMLSEKFGCSRMAVCKAVNSLQEEGYSIDASKRLGYKLNPGFDVLSKLSIEKELSKTGVQVFCFKDIESTNRKAKELSVQGVEPPFVVVAVSQSAGRGRLGRTFVSPEGGMYFSLVLSGKDIVNPDLITTSASLAVSRAMERLTGIKTDIKWVNDLYLNGKKVTGILTEGIVNMEEGGLEQVVIGVGVNLKTKEESFPDELRNIVTSYYPNGVCQVSRAEAIAACVKEILSIQDEDFIQEYRDKCFVIGRKLTVIKGDMSRDALALGIDDFGHLVVQYDDDTITTISSGEVTLKF